MFTVWLCTRISGIRGLIKNDYATEVSSGLYNLLGANGTCTGNGNSLWFFLTAFGCSLRKRHSCSEQVIICLPCLFFCMLG
jgi:hypothetical protein